VIGIKSTPSRSKPGDDGGPRLAGAFCIEFPAPVKGSLTLGYGAHFGLGLFVPADETGQRWAHTSMHPANPSRRPHQAGPLRPARE
jgi:hypothetical protein